MGGPPILPGTESGGLSASIEVPVVVHHWPRKKGTSVDRDPDVDDDVEIPLIREE